MGTKVNKSSDTDKSEQSKGSKNGKPKRKLGKTERADKEEPQLSMPPRKVEQENAVPVMQSSARVLLLGGEC